MRRFRLKRNCTNEWIPGIFAGRCKAATAFNRCPPAEAIRTATFGSKEVMCWLISRAPAVSMKTCCLGFLILITIPFLALSCEKKAGPVTVSSPDGFYEVRLAITECGGLSYSVSWNGTEILSNSELDFILSDSSAVCTGLNLVGVEKSSKDEVWTPVYGEQNSYTDKFNQNKLFLTSSNPAVNPFAVSVRAYNEGIAFRYEFNQAEELNIVSEETEFVFEGNPIVWVSRQAQSPIEKYKLSELSGVYDRPVLAEIGDSLFVALGEAALVDFARMKLKRLEESSSSLVSELTLSRTENGLQPTTIRAGKYNTPWRFIMAGKNPASILQNNYLLLNLNEPNRLDDTSWIRPGKVIREVTLTTQGGMACVDFAAKHNLQYIEFDAGWYGNEYDDASDATTVTVDPKRSPGPLDLQAVIDYAESKNIGVILYVNRRSLEKQLDEVLPRLKSWGVAGVKYGFVNVGSQHWTTWLHDAVRKAADYQLMVDIHDEYRPTGYSRTYPNLMTQEGIRGDEESPTNDLVINTIFTRMIAGAGDQTNCYFADRVSKMGSHASQMAKAICIYSPWQFVFWYDRPAGSPVNHGGAGNAESTIPEIADLTFYEQLPTVWDETRVIDGYPAELAVVARRNGNHWFLGAIAGTKAYSENLKLDFLEAGKEYTATVYSDEPSLGTRTNVKIEKTKVNSESEFPVNISPQKGMAVIFSRE